MNRLKVLPSNGNTIFTVMASYLMVLALRAHKPQNDDSTFELDPRDGPECVYYREIKSGKKGGWLDFNELEGWLDGYELSRNPHWP